jgi:hypothetical protein
VSMLERIPNQEIRKKLAQWYEGVNYEILHIWSRGRPNIEVYLLVVLVPSDEELEFVRVWSATDLRWPEVHLSIDGQHRLIVSR